MRLLTGQNFPIGMLAFSPDARWLLVTSRAGYGSVFGGDTVCIWDLAAGTSRMLPRAFHSVTTTEFQTTGGFDTASTAARTLHPVFTPDSRSVFYVGAGAEAPPSDPVSRSGISLAHTIQWLLGETPPFDPESRSVLFVGASVGLPPRLALRLFDLKSGTSVVLTIPGCRPLDFGKPLFTSDGKRLLSFTPWEPGHAPGVLVLNWTSYPEWQPVGRWSTNEQLDNTLARRNIFAAAFSPGGKALATVSGLGLVLFDTETGAQTHSRKVDLNQLTRFLAFQPAGRQLVFGSGPKVTVFDANTWNPVAELRHKRKHFHSGAFTPDGRRFLTVSNEATVKCWDTADWTLTGEYAWRAGNLRSLAIAPDGMTAVAGGDTGEIVHFDLDQ
jgi:WD40 repeat protein